ncbi:MAG: L,D-transpeptidase family protein [Actinomycetes bacterium]
MRTPRAVVVVITAAIVAVVVALPTGVGLAAYYHDHSRLKVLPSHSQVGNIDVSGLTRAQAIAKVRTVLDRRLDKKATLTVGDNSYTTSLRELGVRDNVAAAVDEAFGSTRTGSWLSRSWRRVFGGESHPTVKVRLNQPSTARLVELVDRAAEAVDVPAVDASVSLSGAVPTFSSAKPGLALDKSAALRALKASLTDGHARHLEPATIRPKADDSAYDTVIVVHIGENRLYLYKHHTLARTFPVATGQTRYPTPTGRYSVTLKRFLPTWYNPHDEWSKSEPATIPPGPHNPLGLRALNLSAPGIRIHGTPSDYSIGYNASHGCIRMHNSDVLQLYPLVPTGATVFLEKYGAYKALPVKAAKKAPPKTSVVNAEGG